MSVLIFIVLGLLALVAMGAVIGCLVMLLVMRKR
jgi:hypothetical protein